jgi:ribosome modulation factor
MIQEQGYAVGWSGGSIKSCPHADDSMRGAWIIGFGLGAEDREHRAAA